MTEKMSAEHQAILDEVHNTAERVDHISKDMEVHIAETHATLVSQAGLDRQLNETFEKVAGWVEDSEKEREAIRGQLNELADAVLGERRVSFDGVVERHGGLKGAIEGNRVRLSLPWGQVWTLVGTIILATATVVAAIIGGG